MKPNSVSLRSRHIFSSFTAGQSVTLRGTLRSPVDPHPISSQKTPRMLSPRHKGITGTRKLLRRLHLRRGFRVTKSQEIEMKKVLIAAALLAGMCGLVVAQGGAGGEPPKASDANPPAATRTT